MWLTYVLLYDGLLVRPLQGLLLSFALSIAQVAAAYSEDKARQGGDLGWKSRHVFPAVSFACDIMWESLRWHARHMQH